jgi:hypothetical protein
MSEKKRFFISFSILIAIKRNEEALPNLFGVFVYKTSEL